MEKMVYEQNGIGQMGWPKWYGQNGTDKILNQSSNLTPTENMIFSSIPLSL